MANASEIIRKQGAIEGAVKALKATCTAAGRGLNEAQVAALWPQFGSDTPAILSQLQDFILAPVDGEDDQRFQTGVVIAESSHVGDPVPNSGDSEGTDD